MTTTSGETSSETASLIDLKAGNVLRRASAIVDENDGRPAVIGVAATTNGSLVWAGKAKDCVGVHMVSAAGARTSSCGTVADLTVIGRRIYWIQDGQPRTAVASKS